MHILPVNDLSRFTDARLFAALSEAGNECVLDWMQFELEPTADNFNAWRDVWEYMDAVYSELSHRDAEKMLMDCAAILAPLRRGQHGKLGGVAI